MYDLFYEHPILGKLQLHEHPKMPWRLVAYYGGTAVYETDKPGDDLDNLLVELKKDPEFVEAYENYEEDDGTLIDEPLPRIPLNQCNA